MFDSSEMPARDRAFILKIAKDLGLENGYIENPTSANSESAPGDQHQKHSKSRGNSAHKHQQIYIRWISENDEDDDEEGSEDEEGLQATLRVLKRYDNAEVLDEAEMAANMEAESKALFEKEFIKWKCDYYKVGCASGGFFELK